MTEISGLIDMLLKRMMMVVVIVMMIVMMTMIVMVIRMMVVVIVMMIREIIVRGWLAIRVPGSRQRVLVMVLVDVVIGIDIRIGVRVRSWEELWVHVVRPLWKQGPPFSTTIPICRGTTFTTLSDRVHYHLYLLHYSQHILNTIFHSTRSNKIRTKQYKLHFGI